MPADILRIRQNLTNNIGAIMLGTVRNDGNQTFNDSLIIVQDGGPPIPYLSLPAVLPPCDWAAITVTVHGCIASAQGTWPAGGLVPNWTPVGLSFIPLNVGPPPAGPGLSPVVNTATMQVGLPLPTVQPGGNQGVLDCWATAGNRYRLDFQVTPLPGIYGLKSWEFSLQPNGERVTLSASLLHPDTKKSE